MSNTPFSMLVGVCVLASIAPPAEASVFLGRGPPSTAMLPLLDELEKIVGKDQRGSTENRVIAIEDALRPTFQAMPKSLEGGIKPDAVRYMVHRYFLDRHGWFVDGLGASADPSSSPAAIFKDQGDDDVQGFFEVRFQKHSFSLHQVAIFAVTIENFVHNETLDRLNAAYRVLGISPTSTEVTHKEVRDVIESYMVMYVLGDQHNYSTMTPEMIRNFRAKIGDYFPSWPATKKWIGDVHREVLNARDSDAFSPTSFNFSAKVLETIGDRYGPWQNTECVDLKNTLVKMETPGTGRVRLDAFYGSALRGNWQFSESVEYLRQHGLLDETDSQRPSVIIANYINAPSNCIASSSFYSLCCMDECESLVSHLETRVASSEASPQRIVEIVSSLPSATVESPRTLPATLVRRLEEIAGHHHGTVPFHGRLFAQWMHHAYPRECSYPDVSSTRGTLTPHEWKRQTGHMHEADKETMMWHVDMAQNAPLSDHEPSELPWLGDEKLFLSKQQPSAQGGTRGLWLAVRGLAGSGAIVSVIVTSLRMFATGKRAKRVVFGSPSEKYFV